MQDQYINHIMNETGATVVLRGRGSGCLENQHGEEAHQPLLSSSNPKSIDDAKRLAENLMDTSSVDFGASSSFVDQVQSVTYNLRLVELAIVGMPEYTLKPLHCNKLLKSLSYLFLLFMEKERRPSQKRKFQELPAECKVPAKSKEGETDGSKPT
ncbi:unnamed protein product, partial [Brassica oleracea var. botrytis]